MKYKETLLDDDEKRLEFYRMYKADSVPYLLMNGNVIGVYRNILRYFRSALMQFNQTYKPFKYPWAVDITIRHEKTHWIEDEIDLVEDVNQWKGGKLAPVEKKFITNILRLFTQSDVAVGQNYCDQFIPIFKNNEVRNMLLSIACREGTHQRAYALLNDTLGLPTEEYHAFLEYKEMADKIDFMTDSDISSMKGIALALVKTVFNEGVALMSAFMMLLNFQRFGKMKGMGKVVEWSVRDETIHVEAAIKLFRTFEEENVPELYVEDFYDSVYSMARQVARLETTFIELAYKLGPIEGLEKEGMIQFVHHMIDRRLLQMGFNALFGAEKNPLEWVDWVLNGTDHTNFFENRVTEYEVAGIKGSWENVY